MPLLWKLMRAYSFQFKNIFKSTFSSKKVPFNTPKPVPLGNSKDRKEMDQLIRSGGPENNTVIIKEKKEFEGPKNPETGEIGGPKGKEPTRFGDWEKNGRTSDF